MSRSSASASRRSAASRAAAARARPSRRTTRAASSSSSWTWRARGGSGALGFSARRRRHFTQLAPQLERAADAAQRLERRAGADHRDVTVIEKAAEEALVHVQALHLGEVHLHGGAGDEAALGDDPPVGENELRGAAAHEGHDDEREADEGGHGGDQRPAAAVEVNGGAGADDAQHAEEIRSREHPVRDGGAMHDALTRCQYGFDVAHGRLGRWPQQSELPEERYIAPDQVALVGAEVLSAPIVQPLAL